MPARYSTPDTLPLKRFKQSRSHRSNKKMDDSIDSKQRCRARRYEPLMGLNGKHLRKIFNYCWRCCRNMRNEEKKPNFTSRHCARNCANPFCKFCFFVRWFVCVCVCVFASQTNFFSSWSQLTKPSQGKTVCRLARGLLNFPPLLYYIYSLNFHFKFKFRFMLMLENGPARHRPFHSSAMGFFYAGSYFRFYCSDLTRRPSRTTRVGSRGTVFVWRFASHWGCQLQGNIVKHFHWKHYFVQFTQN